MKKSYQKPEAEIISFEIDEQITAGVDGSNGAEDNVDHPDWT